MIKTTVFYSFQDECNPSEWCLSEEQIQHRIDEKYAQFCGLQDCLLDITDDCMNEVSHQVISFFFFFLKKFKKKMRSNILVFESIYLATVGGVIYKDEQFSNIFILFQFFERFK